MANFGNVLRRFWAGTCSCVEGAFPSFGSVSHLPIIAGSPKEFEEGRGGKRISWPSKLLGDEVTRIEELLGFRRRK